MTVSRADPLRLGLLIAGSMCLLPFLQPRHMPPLRAFYDEWLAFVLGCIALGVAAIRPSQSKATIDTSALWLLAFAGYLLVRAGFVTSTYVQSPLLWAVYAAFAALMVSLGRELVADMGRDRVVMALAACFAVGATANAAIGILQVAGIPAWLSSFVAHPQGTRATGNVGQANLYSNYLALGSASLAFLYARGKLGGAVVGFLGAVVVIGISLSASRASVVYAVAFSALAVAAAHRNPTDTLVRLRLAVFIYAAACILAQWLVPAGLEYLGYRVEGGFVRNAAPKGGAFDDEATNLRLSAWLVALRLFVESPFFGVGPDEFPGAAFRAGLPAELAGSQLWTSPHNLILHLLCETGLAGTALVVGGIAAWGHGMWKWYRASCDAAIWWISACVGVELVHALLEYPLWYAHFLAIAALLMGLGSNGSLRAPPRAVLGACLVAAIFGTALLASTLVAYLKFDLASPAAAGRSLASDAVVERQRVSLAELSHGLLAPRAETWLFLSQSLDDSNLAEKLAVGRRVLRLWPSREIICRQVLYLELGGHTGEVRDLLARGRASYPDLGKAMRALAESAPQKSREILIRISGTH